MKHKWGERRDGRLLRDIDSMHFIMPLMYPKSYLIVSFI